VLAERGGASTLVFDEIDSGTGGETAGKLADSLHRAARSRQVIVVSHLAQIASRADRHLMVSKESSSGMPLTRVTHLSERALRLNELARLLGGGPGSKDHAGKLLEQAF
jgi:DNA repair protein RecN (Recombination protein N)